MLTALHDDDRLHVARLDGEGDVVWLAFAGYGGGMGAGGSATPVEFLKSASAAGVPAVFIVDRTRNWYDATDMDALAALIAPFIAGRRTMAVGSSMGGFGAILASRAVPMDVCVAFSTQYAISRAHVPEERRWQEAARRLAHPRHPHLGDRFNATTRYFLLSGDAPEERIHWERMPDAPNIHNLVFPGHGHALARDLKADGRFATILREASLGGERLVGDPAAFGCYRHRPVG